MKTNAPLQRYAFVHYTHELAQQVLELYTDERPFMGDVPNPNTIRLDVIKMTYLFARSTNSGLQRPFLDPSVISMFPLIPTPEARQMLLEDLYEDLRHSETEIHNTVL